MALTKVTGSVIKDSVSLSGNVSIGGTLTYQDVTNIDSLGIITARTGVDVSGGQLDVGSNVKIGNSGVATATNFKTGSSNLHSTGLTVGNNFLHSTGINVGTGATIHVPATNVITFGTSNNERLRIASDGKVGIGTDATGSQLSVGRASGNSGLTLDCYGVNRSRLIFRNNVVRGTETNIDAIDDDLRFITNSGERLRIAASGNIIISGITTSNTGFMFGTDGEMYLYKSAANTATLRITSDGPYAEFKDVSGDVQIGSASGTLRLSAGAAEKLRVNTAGQIMIGDSTVGNSSNSKLIIQGMATNASYEASIALRRGSTIGSNDAGLGYIKFQDSAGSTGASMGGRADSGWSGSSRPTHLLFYTTQSASNSPTERMRIHSGGSVTKPSMPVASFSDSRAVDVSNAILTSSNFYNHQWWNNGSHFNTSNGRFTCPVAGVYRIYFRATCDTDEHTNVRLRKNGGTINEAYANYSSGQTSSDSSEAIVHCSANDYLEIQVSRLKTNAGTQHKQVTFQLLH